MDEKAAAKSAGEVRRATEFEDLTTVKAIMITTAVPTENLLRARIQTLLRRRDRDVGMLRPSSSDGMSNFVFYSRYQEQRYVLLLMFGAGSVDQRMRRHVTSHTVEKIENDGWLQERPGSKSHSGVAEIGRIIFFTPDSRILIPLKRILLPKERVGPVRNKMQNI
jgi:hypothetical protein